MNTPLTEKNIAAWNDQPLDTRHDIIVSFDYARYNDQIPPTGGFAIIFFNSIVDMPHYGGPEYALGYNPSTDTSFCRLQGYQGLEAAFLGVGFDNQGLFAAKTDAVDGLTANYYPNSFAVRDGVDKAYTVLYNSPDLLYANTALLDFTVDQKISNESEIIYRSVRLILAKASTELKVQLKSNSNDAEYVTVATVPLPYHPHASIKVGLTNTCTEPYTRMKIKNFNVAGYPGETTTRDLSGCSQTIHQKSYSKGTFLPMGEEFLVTSVGNNLLTYTTDASKYFLKNTNYSGSGIEIIGCKDNFVLTRLTNTDSLVIYKYLGEKLSRTYTIASPDGSAPLCADIYNNDTLVMCTSALSGSIYFYNFISDTSNPSLIGTWRLFQTITADSALSGSGLGISCSIYDRNLLVGNQNQLVHAYQQNTAGTWQFLQTISDPMSGITKFGNKVSIHGRDAMLCAPYSEKEKFHHTGQGEVYHYYLYSATNTWERVMNIGSFYGINTPAGNFGTSIGFNENTLIVGAPSEMWLEDATLEFEDQPNVGRAYVFKKTTNGLFTQGAILYPASDFKNVNMYYGKCVNVVGDYAAVVATYTAGYSKSNISIYDLNCTLPLPPLHLPVPDCAMALSDGSGFVISTNNNTYLLTLSCVLGLL